MYATAFNEPHWEMPVLVSAPPRQTRLTGSGLLLRFLAWFLFPALACAMFFIGRDDVNVLEHLSRVGQLVQGQVTDKYVSSGKTTTYYVSYTASGGVSGKERVPSSAYESYWIGGPALITEDLANPTIHVLGRVTPSRIQRARTTAIALDVIMAAASLLLFALLEAALRREQKFARFGLALPARIISVVGNGRSGLLYYDYQRPDGSVAHAAARCTNPRRFMPGVAAAVFYLPNDKRKTCLVEGLTYVSPVR